MYVQDIFLNFYAIGIFISFKDKTLQTIRASFGVGHEDQTSHLLLVRWKKFQGATTKFNKVVKTKQSFRNQEQ